MTPNPTEEIKTIDLENLLEYLLKKQHEVIDGALRREVVDVSHILSEFAKLGVSPKENLF